MVASTPSDKTSCQFPVRCDSGHMQTYAIKNVFLIWYSCRSHRYWLLLFITFLLNLFVLLNFSVPEDRRNDATKLVMYFHRTFWLLWIYRCIVTVYIFYHGLCSHLSHDMLYLVPPGLTRLVHIIQMCRTTFVLIFFLCWGGSILY